MTYDFVHGLLTASYVPTAPIVGWFVVYLVGIALLGFIVPGKVHTGTVLADGTRLTYKCCGLNILMLLVAGLYVCTYQLGLFKATVLYDNFGPLCVTVHIWAFMLSTYLYVRGKARGAKGHHPESPFWNFIMGMELNPRVLGIDIKLYSLRPAMMGWMLLNLSFLAKHIELLGTVTLPMALYQLYTNFYILDYFFNEVFMTSTWDIIAEHFGLMLIWGDYCWIPFTFTVQCWFLLEVTPLHPLVAAFSFVLFFVGFYIFRVANMQKHNFKHDPKALIWGKPPVVIGGKLLCSGFWAYSRHMNYCGDLMMALSYALPCGTASIFAYLYPIYLLILLIHRERRDEERCAAKYKELWKQYTTTVRYRIFPGIY